jgi:alpha-L-arabinofuranosidase
VPFQDATFVPVKFEAGTYTHEDIKLPRLDAIAAKDKSGKLWLELTNIDPNHPVDIELDIPGMTPKYAFGESLTAAKVDSVNTFDAPNNVKPKTISAQAIGGKLSLKLDPLSVTVVSVE